MQHNHKHNLSASRESTEMEKLMNPMFLITPLLSLLFLWLLTKWLLKSPTNKNSPPSPLKLPIIGNIHQLGSLPHRNLRSLAKRHGPLMSLRLGSAAILVVSSSEAADEIMRTHDLAFADRPVYKVFKTLLYNCRDVSVAPYGEYWRQMKSIFVLQLLSNKRVQSFRTIREEVTALLVKKVRESPAGAAVDLSAMFAEFTNDVISRSALGRKYSVSEKGKRFVFMLSEAMKVAGISVGDFIPWLSWISRVNGVDKRIDVIRKELDDFLESMIEEHLEALHGKNGDGNFLEILLDIYNCRTEASLIERDSVKALLLDVFVGGTDTITTVLEWAMAELLQHPNAMEKLQKEAREIVQDNRDITHEDLDKMHYMKAVVKETFRFHPPLPLLVPRVAREDVKVQGFDVPAGTLVMINAWAIGRDPVSWDEPERFMPERFLDSSIDFKGLDFELIPFGAGRRGCPGILFAGVTIEFVLASLVQKFNWKLGNGAEGVDMDMSECPGATVRRALPLLAIPT